LIRVNLGFVSNITTLAFTVDFHNISPKTDLSFVSDYIFNLIVRDVPKAEVKEYILSGGSWPKIAPGEEFGSVCFRVN
jgi:hypothetical protein